MQSVNDIRRAFLDFFGGREHLVVPSAPLVPQNDPTLLFVNAGMVPFKNVFTGAETAPAPRAASSQKCVRARGKHNDLDNVGYTARHHTFFEMLGNFSFGDYFKPDAIEWAWTLVTKEYGLAKDKLTVTVFSEDDEAHALWKKIAGLPESRIIRIPTTDNFWSMGDTGPCGPCSEIFFDHGDKIPGGPPGSADADGDRFIEIWNLVFMQFEQVTKEERIALPKPSIDTGMGLERIAAVLQGTHDNYETDLFRVLIAAIVDKTGVPAEGAAKASNRVIADHLRASSFLIADGVLPSNEGRGYVLRRSMRRAMRHAELLGQREPLMWKLVPTLVHEMGAAYAELQRTQDLITETLRLEETRFRKTLERGLRILDEESQGLKSGDVFAGDTAAIVTNQTTFYAESGGQTGDHGVIRSASDGVFRVTGTEKRLGDLVIHVGQVESGTLTQGEAVELNVDHGRRSGNRQHHSATHLLHEALRKTLGTHVAQKGSLVEPNRLRFDFSHNKGMSAAELAAVETMANDIVLQNDPVNTRLMSVDAAVAEGAMALFGEKYGDEVRVVSMGRNPEGSSRPIYSLELCGGTHVSRTGDIGFIKILAESGSAAGVRRLEALAGTAAREYLEQQDKRVAAAAALLKTSPAEIVNRIESLVDERKKLERELAEAKKALALGGVTAAGDSDIQTVNGIKFMKRVL